MDLYITMLFFMIGTILGSFYMVVAYRLPNGESIVSPPSHCNNCNHTLGILDLIPIFSFLFHRGKCKYCKVKLSFMYPIYEFLCGLLFALTYISFGFGLELLIALTFLSMLLIIVLSDYEYMIIPDEVLIVFGLFLILELLCLEPTKILFHILDGVICFTVMFLLKQFGDFLFKRESMGGGDIKLMFVFGLVLGWEMAIFSIFVGSLIALPISCVLLYLKKDHVIPFGPFLSAGALVILLFHIDVEWLLTLLKIK